MRRINDGFGEDFRMVGCSLSPDVADALALSFFQRTSHCYLFRNKEQSSPSDHNGLDPQGEVLMSFEASVMTAAAVVIFSVFAAVLAWVDHTQPKEPKPH
jgi:hypothetical protein